MGRNSFISLAVIRRMPRYYRYLKFLKDTGVKTISSRELAECMDLTASQIRQDFNCFGNFGQQGTGYDVGLLTDSMSEILGINRKYNIIIMGLGQLGKALIDNFNFEITGNSLIGAIDLDSSENTFYNNVPVFTTQSIYTYVSKNTKPDVGVLAVSPDKAKEAAEVLIKCGVKAIWNITHTDLSDIESKGIIVENLHLSDSMLTLSYRLTEYENSVYDN